MTKRTAEFVRNARDKLALSQRDFAAKLGLSRHSIMRYEDPRYRMPEHVRLAIAALLEKESET